MVSKRSYWRAGEWGQAMWSFNWKEKFDKKKLNVFEGTCSPKLQFITSLQELRTGLNF